jgi:hypothetical protein
MELDSQQLNAIRNVRDENHWSRYDSVVIGPGASQQAPGWFDTFAAFANTDEHIFFTSARTSSAGLPYVNTSGQSEDWRQDVYALRVEAFSTFGWEGADQNALDSGFLPLLWSTDVPRRSSGRLRLADTDDVLIQPVITTPGVVGPAGGDIGAAASTATLAPGQGIADQRAGWVFPRPLQVPAKGKITFAMKVGEPIRGFLAQLTALPQRKNVVVPGVAGPSLTSSQTVSVPNWYVIRVSLVGPRFLQLRGARSS